MRPFRLRFSLLMLATAAGLAANTRITPDKPIVNFTLPDFTPEGYRSMLLRGSEARYITDGVVDIKELNLTLFSRQADEKIQTLLLSPIAQVRIGDRQVSGPDSIRIIDDRFEASGSNWIYDHQEKRVSITKNVRVVLHTQLNDILK